MNRVIAILLLLVVAFGCEELTENACIVTDMEVVVGECETDSTFNLLLDFKSENVNGDYLTGGAFSLDGIHLTPRGYAIVANGFIETI